MSTVQLGNIKMKLDSRQQLPNVNNAHLALNPLSTVIYRKAVQLVPLVKQVMMEHVLNVNLHRKGL